MPKKANKGPQKPSDLQIGMKFQDMNPRIKGVRTVEIVEIGMHAVICESWYYGKKEKKIKTRIMKRRLLKRGHRGYRFKR